MCLEVIVHRPQIRFVIVHYHIFKNGGSTIESVLAREFPGCFATLHGPTQDAVLDGSDLAEFLEHNPMISAVSSHHLRYPKPVIRDKVLFDCCFLRHPLDRVQSMHSYFRRIEPADPLGLLAHNQSAREFVKGLLDKSPHQISDVQVHQLANGGAFTRPACEGDLERATRILLEMAIPGVVDMFDESLVAAEYFLNPAFPGIRLEYVQQNVSRSSLNLSIPERERQYSQLWGNAIYEEVTRLNQFDFELYRRAKEEIGRRLALVPKSSEKLLEFRSRSRIAEVRTVGMGKVYAQRESATVAS